MKEFTLCGGRHCCPKLYIMDDDTVEINDDYGGRVAMTKKQAKELCEKLNSEL